MRFPILFSLTSPTPGGKVKDELVLGEVIHRLKEQGILWKQVVVRELVENLFFNLLFRLSRVESPIDTFGDNDNK